ncbi:cysteine protease ATG4C isoform X1 [Syngnathus scovelli]|uniref:cysteine protease ATG4C isoform X1 n=1 Tax=Syngnathus scovelli TaxID=161590 RepID=UPI00210FE298|nr:cysteine protease ATG4C isoform X1 [Syngnathus scovelli]XP_049583036.1 cysteine protease ATG4C isoform X1 [Syngnathus scovelli]
MNNVTVCSRSIRCVFFFFLITANRNKHKMFCSSSAIVQDCFLFLGWALKSKTLFSRNSPVLLLGKCYHFKAEDDSDSEASDRVMGNIEDFRRDFGSRIWLTYREEFPPLPGSVLTSDCGWGCMLRAGQMMLAQALILHVLGRDWTWSEALQLQCLDAETWTTAAAKRLVESVEASLQGTLNRPSSNPQSSATEQAPPGPAEEADAHLKEMYHRTLISCFGDIPSAQLGLHRLVLLGLTLGKQAGDWYGPAAVAHILKKAMDEAKEPALSAITAYVSQDCTVYSADVIDSHKAAKAGTSDALPLPQNPQSASASTLPDARAVVILIPVRLGGEKINPEYFNFAKRILSLEYCIGIIGGKPKQACYFVGFQDDSLIYMDPHYCQSFVDVSTSDFPLQSYHCPSPKKMPFTQMDPSCTIGFYSRSVQDYEKISRELSQVLQPSASDKYPAFTIVQGHGRDYDLSAGLTPEKREWPFIRDPRRTITTAGDFVLL